MPKWIYVVESNCKVPSREGDFIHWYHTEHLPERLLTPGFKTAQLYMNTNQKQGEGKFIAIYGIESDNIEKTMAERREIARRAHPASQGMPSVEAELLEVVSLRMFQEVPCPR